MSDTIYRMKRQYINCPCLTKADETDAIRGGFSQEGVLQGHVRVDLNSDSHTPIRDYRLTPVCSLKSQN